MFGESFKLTASPYLYMTCTNPLASPASVNVRARPLSSKVAVYPSSLPLPGTSSSTDSGRRLSPISEPSGMAAVVVITVVAANAVITTALNNKRSFFIGLQPPIFNNIILQRFQITVNNYLSFLLTL